MPLYDILVLRAIGAGVENKRRRGDSRAYLVT